MGALRHDEALSLNVGVRRLHPTRSHARLGLLLVVLSAGLSSTAYAEDASSPPAGRQPATPDGCYQADRPLGTSAGSALGRGVPGLVGRRIGEDSASLPQLTTFQLLPSGGAARPGTALQGLWASGSRWALAGDTLQVTLSTRTAGWRLRLVRASPSDSVWFGTARYLTDVVVKDGAGGPLEYPIRVRQQRCAP